MREVTDKVMGKDQIFWVSWIPGEEFVFSSKCNGKSLEGF